MPSTGVASTRIPGSDLTTTPANPSNALDALQTRCKITGYSASSASVEIIQVILSERVGGTVRVIIDLTPHLKTGAVPGQGMTCNMSFVDSGVLFNSGVLISSEQSDGTAPGATGEISGITLFYQV